jgi:hypothetical protein
MTSSRLGTAQRYQAAIRRALLTDWDPIGIGDDPNAQDEYDSYIGTIYKMLITRAPRNQFIDYLWWVETEHMGLAGNRAATEHFVDRLLRIPEEVVDE